MNSKLKRVAIDFTPPYFLRLAKRIYRGKYLAKDELDKKMEKYLNYNGGFFVELGANEGIVQSNTYYYEKQRNWQGILIEPSSNKYLECKKNRANRNHVYCAACVSFDFKDEFVKMAYSDYMTAPINLESDLENPLSHAKNGEQYLENNGSVFIFGAQAVTLNSLFIKSSAPALMDFLSLDVEGAEIEVLKGINHNQFRFKYMLVECRNFEKLKHYLKDLDYSFLEKLSRHDYLFEGKV